MENKNFWLRLLIAGACLLLGFCALCYFFPKTIPWDLPIALVLSGIDIILAVINISLAGQSVSKQPGTGAEAAQVAQKSAFQNAVLNETERVQLEALKTVYDDTKKKCDSSFRLAGIAVIIAMFGFIASIVAVLALEHELLIVPTITATMLMLFAMPLTLLIFWEKQLSSKYKDLKKFYQGVAEHQREEMTV